MSENSVSEVATPSESGIFTWGHIINALDNNVVMSEVDDVWASAGSPAESERSLLESKLSGLSSTSEIDEELERLRNLTLKQLKALIEDNGEEIRRYQDIIAQSQLELDLFERGQCESDRTREEEEYLKAKRRQVREHEIYLAKLMERTKLLKSIRPKYQSFDVAKLPQVILCDHWPSDGSIPKIVVCQKAKKTKSTQLQEEREKEKKNQTCLTLEQLQLIEKEKRRIELECGQLQLQIAGVKGQAKVISNENNKLTAIIGKELDAEPTAYPCTKNMRPNTVVCPAFEKPPIPILKIDVASTPINPDCEILTSSEYLLEELKNIEKKVEKLQADLAKGKQRGETMKAQQEALDCLKEALK